MPKIKHFALTTSDPGKAAEFCKQALDLEEVRRDSKGQVFLSDGEFNMAILHFKTDDDSDVGAHGPNFSGIHHIGFYVEDLEAQADRESINLIIHHDISHIHIAAHGMH